MYINIQMLNTHIHQIHMLIGQALKIEDHDWKSTKELNDEIKLSNRSIHDNLESYITNLFEWYNICEKIEQEGKSSDLHNQLLNSINKRDSSRKSLVQKYKSIT